jgi:hypothetical protein
VIIKLVELADAVHEIVNPVGLIFVALLTKTGGGGAVVMVKVLDDPIRFAGISVLELYIFK